MHLGRPARTAVRSAAVLLFLVPAAAGCSSDGGGGSRPAASSPAVSGPVDPTRAKAEIEKNWEAFFAAATPAAQRAGLLENGAALEPLLAGLSTESLSAKPSARVTEVSFTSPTGARVTYDLLVGGTAVLPGSKGTAVLQDGVWKVSAKTVCDLVALSGKSVPGVGC
ncbi:hypothetical protein DEJ50_26405 [Streptomyces venezuelae]|uniref:Low molecular weight antigen MTB12-like C-terminal domain-containing protein n=1 Tax=Streptomyces venezuelae TaxID=54571 RepID=A0A5P2DC68_STRVZ|nr:hypothetical protein [Streptomyces venezuelae]QES52686.1 hypothetical protein DEJ50_26405 [Streptomyces venezuelae]